MKKLALFSIILLALALTASGAEKKPRPFETVKVPALNPIMPPNVEKAVFDNGLKVFFFEKHELPLISIVAMVRGGSVSEDKVGQAELFGEVLRTGGTRSMNGDKVDEFLEKIGASIETYSDDAFTMTRARMLKENKDEVVPLFAEFLTSPAFTEDKIELAKTKMRSEISRRNDEVDEIGRREFIKLVYGKNSPYARQLEYENVESLNREDLLRFHTEFFRPDETYIAVIGDFDTKEMKASLEKLLGGWKNSTPKQAHNPPQIPSPRASVNFIEKDDVEQTTILLGHLGLRLDDPDYPSVNMLSEILGGSMASRIFVQVRTLKGLAYGAGGYMMPAYDHNGAFYFYTSTKVESSKEALQTILDEIKKIRNDKVTDEELKRSKDSYLNGYAFEFDSVEKIARRMLLYNFYGYPEKFNEELRSKIENVSADDVLNAAKNHLFDDKLAILVVGKKEVKDALSAFGKVNVIDITIPDPPESETLPEATPESLKQGTELLKGVAAKVGEKQLAGLRNFAFEGVVSIISPMGQMDVRESGTVVFPDKIYLEMFMPVGKMEQVIKSGEGYISMGDKKKSIPESQLKEVKKSINMTLCGASMLKDVLAGKLKGQYIGEKEIQSKKTKLVLVRMDGEPVKVYISEDGLICGMSRRQNGEKGPTEMTEYFSDFRDVNGLKAPFASKTMDKNEESQHAVYSKIQINVDVPEKVESILGLK